MFIVLRLLMVLTFSDNIHPATSQRYPDAPSGCGIDPGELVHFRRRFPAPPRPRGAPARAADDPAVHFRIAAARATGRCTGVHFRYHGGRDPALGRGEPARGPAP